MKTATINPTFSSKYFDCIELPLHSSDNDWPIYFKAFTGREGVRVGYIEPDGSFALNTSVGVEIAMFELTDLMEFITSIIAHRNGTKSPYYNNR